MYLRAFAASRVIRVLTPARSHGLFTLIELLVVIAIFAILSSLLMPALLNAQKTAHQIACLSNVKQVGQGVFLYAADSQNAFPTYVTDLGGGRWTRWYSLLTPILSSGATDCEEHAIADVLYCPAITWGRQQLEYFGYGVNIYMTHHNGFDVGVGWGFRLNKIIKPSETILCGDNSISEKQGVAPFWSSRGNLYFPNEMVAFPDGHIPDWMAAIDKHNGGKNLIWADGHATWEELPVMQAHFDQASDLGGGSYSRDWWTARR